VRRASINHPLAAATLPEVMIWFLGSLYIIVGMITIVLVLLHSGRGGGLSDMFGGGLGAAAAGSTSMERNLDRMTIVFGLVFTFLTIALAFLIDV
jgi:preprotein translocase subunit SecG